ncbi:MAG: tol-pal system protein YbgF [Chitinivibrionales bacterium]|nr:tol-pal system protein YbgF [Chitinivibrionales bacterium]
MRFISECRPRRLTRVALACGAVVLSRCATQRGLTPAEQLLPEIDIVKLHDDAAKALAAVEELQAEVARLRKRLSACEAAYASGPQSGVPASPQPPRERVATHERTAPGGSEPAREDSGGRRGSESELYRQALKAFRSRDYRTALRTLTAMVEAYPDGGYAENGHYWIGECHYGLKDYQRAVVSFQQVLALPAKTKDDDAQLKLGVCYVKLGQNDRARRSFESLLREYPSSEYAPRARSYLARLSR